MSALADSVGVAEAEVAGTAAKLVVGSGQGWPQQQEQDYQEAPQHYLVSIHQKD